MTNIADIWRFTVHAFGSQAKGAKFYLKISNKNKNGDPPSYLLQFEKSEKNEWQLPQL